MAIGMTDHSTQSLGIDGLAGEPMPTDLREGRALTGVGCVLSVSHPPVNADIFGGEDHGHSYEVIVWFDNAAGPRDVRMCQAAVETLRLQLDHKRLPPDLATGEALARYFGALANVVEVEVRRPLERIYAKWIA
jgi:hypothetical protein